MRQEWGRTIVSYGNDLEGLHVIKQAVDKNVLDWLRYLRAEGAVNATAEATIEMATMERNMLIVIGE